MKTHTHTHTKSPQIQITIRDAETPDGGKSEAAKEIT